jgi:urease subunit alpha
MVAISRRAYAELYGPTKGDLVRLGDTSLLAEIEHDYTIPGHELVVGAGKTLRDGEGINPRMRYSDKALDIVIQNATIIDAELGIVKRTSASATAASSASARPATRMSCPAFIRI